MVNRRTSKHVDTCKQSAEYRWQAHELAICRPETLMTESYSYHLRLQCRQNRNPRPDEGPQYRCRRICFLYSNSFAYLWKIGSVQLTKKINISKFTLRYTVGCCAIFRPIPDSTFLMHPSLKAQHDDRRNRPFFSVVILAHLFYTPHTHPQARA